MVKEFGREFATGVMNGLRFSSALQTALVDASISTSLACEEMLEWLDEEEASISVAADLLLGAKGVIKTVK